MFKFVLKDLVSSTLSPGETVLMEGVESWLGVAYTFGLQELVHLFSLYHFLCPPPQFICTGLSSCLYIFKQGLLSVEWKCWELSDIWRLYRGGTFTSVCSAARVKYCSGTRSLKKKKKAGSKQEIGTRQMETKGNHWNKSGLPYRKHTLGYFSRWPLVCGGGKGLEGGGPICTACPRLLGHVRRLDPRQSPTPLCGGQSGPIRVRLWSRANDSSLKEEEEKKDKQKKKRQTERGRAVKRTKKVNFHWTNIKVRST